jgi:hypothetical protein
MKKVFFAALFAGCVLSLAAQSGEGTASFSTDYVPSHFTGVTINECGDLVGATRLIRGASASLEEKQVYGGLDGNKSVDTATELLAMASVLGIQDVKKEDALKLYVEIAMEGAANSFLGVTGTTHSQVLERLRGKYNFTQKEITDAIRATVAAAVDAEFNKVEFVFSTGVGRGRGAVLVWENNQYTLSYESGHANNNAIKTLSAPTLDALKAEMRKKTDFDEAGIQSVHNNAALMPSILQIRGSKVSSSVLFTEIMTGFYTARTPEEQNSYYKALLGFDARLQSMILTREGNSAEPISRSWVAALSAINPELARKSVQDSLNLSNLADLNNEVDRVARMIPR